MKLTLVFVCLVFFFGVSSAVSNLVCDSCDDLIGTWDGLTFTRSASTSSYPGVFPYTDDTFACIPSFATPVRAPTTFKFQRGKDGVVVFNPVYRPSWSYDVETAEVIKTYPMKPVLYTGDVFFLQNHIVVSASNGQIVFQTTTGQTSVPYSWTDDGELIIEFNYNYATNELIGNDSVNLDVSCDDASHTVNNIVLLKMK